MEDVPGGTTEVVAGVPKLAIVAALEREISPFVKGWRVREQEYAGRRFRFYERDQTVLVCGGIGNEPARRATEAIIALHQPVLIYSAGFAGALDPTLQVGDVILPRRVVNAADGSSVDTGQGEGASAAGPEQKKRLADSYGAQAVDMEAAAVARAAEARGVRFAAVKAISDERDFPLPAMDRFINAEGLFNSARFAWFAAIRPWMWPTTLRLARNSRRASRSLCSWIEHMEVSQALMTQPAVAPVGGSARQP